MEPVDRELLVRSLAATYGDGFAIGDHDHSWGQLVYAVSGVMRVTTKDLVAFVPPTRAIWLPPHHRHRIVMRGQVALRTLYLAPATAGRLATQPVTLGVVPVLRELILHILQRGMLGAEGVEGRLVEVLIDLIAEARSEDLVLPLPRDRRARALSEHLQARPCDRSDLAALARDTGASLRTLQRIFPEETGLTIDAWRQKARLIHGVTALSAGTPVTIVAPDCGFESVSAFITAFKRQFGVTPGRYRSAAQTGV